MGIPILFEINEELTRLFIAGSRLVIDDPRIKKYINPLQKIGEKAPVFLKLSEQLEQLLVVDPILSAQKLIETESLLLAILNTQGETKASNELLDLPENKEILGETQKSYKELYPIIEALRKSGSNRPEIIKNALQNNVFADPRMIFYVASALGDANSELVAFLIKNVIPKMDKAIFKYIKEDFNIEGKAADVNRLRAMYKIKGIEILPFIKECLEKGNTAIRVEAIEILSDYKENECLLLDLLDEKKAIKEAVMHGLLKMKSETGVNKIIEIYNSKDRKIAIPIITRSTMEYLTEKMLNIAQQSYDNIKAENISKEQVLDIYNAIETLRNKKSVSVAKFLEGCLSETYLNNAFEILNKEEKITLGNLFDNTLEILYESGYGNEYIWNLFMATQQILLDKLLNKKTLQPSKMLNVYAFTIGLTKLDPEKFFDVFFKSKLFNQIDKMNPHLFNDAFLENRGKIKPSKRMATYFIEINDYYRATRVIRLDDYETIAKLIEIFHVNINKNLNSSNNFYILDFLKRNKREEFNELFELFCSDKYSSKSQKESSIKYLQREV